MAVLTAAINADVESVDAGAPGELRWDLGEPGDIERVDITPGF